MGKRIFLFIAVNILVVATISIILQVLGVGPYLTQRGIDYGPLLVMCLVWGFGGALISLMLSKTIAKWELGVVVLDPNAPSADQQWLFGTIHRLAQEAGLKKMPEVGYYESPEPNAFATGPSQNDALVAVSSGLLHNMSKDEVEGVLGHEITHIANGDMVTMTLLQGVINAFVMFLARILAFFLSQGNRRENNGIAQFFLVMMLQTVLSFLGSFLVLAFSRYREYRADEGGARLAGKQKMISALEALEQMHERARQERQTAPAQPSPVATLQISGSSQSFLGELLASHPPLEKRIERLKNLPLA